MLLVINDDLIVPFFAVQARMCTPLQKLLFAIFELSFLLWNHLMCMMCMVLLPEFFFIATMLLLLFIELIGQIQFLKALPDPVIPFSMYPRCSACSNSPILSRQVTLPFLVVRISLMCHIFSWWQICRRRTRICSCTSSSFSRRYLRIATRTASRPTA